jgi:hypothetical protein
MKSLTVGEDQLQLAVTISNFLGIYLIYLYGGYMIWDMK